MIGLSPRHNVPVPAVIVRRVTIARWLEIRDGRSADLGKVASIFPPRSPKKAL